MATKGPVFVLLEGTSKTAWGWIVLSQMKVADFQESGIKGILEEGKTWAYVDV